MRTKALLLSAALVAAGVATSMAQTSNVYSLNIVGYVNVPITGGYNLIVNQLDVDGVDNVNTVLTNGTPDQTQLFTWNGTGFNPSVTFFAGTGWLDLNNGGNPATNNVPPGNAFFLFNPGGAATITLVGQVSSSTNHIPVTAGYGFYGVVPPLASDLDTNGFPAEDQMQFFTFGSGAYSSGFTFFAGTGWLDLNNGGAQVFPTPAVGQGFLIFNPDAATTWTQTFVVQ